LFCGSFLFSHATSSISHHLLFHEINVTNYAGIVHPAVPALCYFLPAAAYRPRTAQLISAFCIGLRVRISHTTGEQSRPDNQGEPGI
jgi:hypothetical protein